MNNLTAPLYHFRIIAGVNQGADHTFFLLGISGLSLTKSATINGQPATQAKSGDIITYTIQYTASQQANNVKIEDPIPNSTTYQSGGTYDSVNNKVYWNLGNLFPGASGNVTFQVKVN